MLASGFVSEPLFNTIKFLFLNSVGSAFRCCYYMPSAKILILKLEFFPFMKIIKNNLKKTLYLVKAAFGFAGLSHWELL